MKPSTILSTIIPITAVAAQDISSYVAQIPSCMNDCFSSLFKEFNCNNNDWKCLCTSKTDVNVGTSILSGQGVLTAFAFASTQECRDADNNCDANDPLLGTSVDTADLALVSICEVENGNIAGLNPAQASSALSALADATSLLSAGAGIASGTSSLAISSLASSLATQLNSVVSSTLGSAASTAVTSSTSSTSNIRAVSTTAPTSGTSLAAASTSSAKGAAHIGVTIADGNSMIVALGMFLMGIMA